MSSSALDIEFEEQLREAGNLLLGPPADSHELSALLDKVESVLANVEQAPDQSVRRALLPSMKALVANEIMRHADEDVRISVASCMSEITRITAPDAPYDDNEMREIFRLIVSALQKLSDMSGRSYTKAVNILDIVAKVRSCLLMLDLECDALIIEMFQIFLRVIRSNHPNDIFSAMEKTMTLVIEESEDVSWDLLNTLLASVRKESQDDSSSSWKLGEKVIANCAAKLKPYLREALQSRGIILNEYAGIISEICKYGDDTLQLKNCNGTGEHTVTEELESTSPREVCHDVDGISKSLVNNGTAPENEDSFINDKSSKVLELCSLSEHPKSTDGREQCKSADVKESPRSMDEQEHPKSTDARELQKTTDVKSGIEQESVPTKRGRKPNSLMNPEEGYDHSWICTGRKTPAVLNHRKSLDKGVDQTSSGNSDSKKSAILLKLKMVSESASAASSKSSLPDVSDSKRGRRKKKGSVTNEIAHPNSQSASTEKSLSVQIEEKAPQSEIVGVKKEAEESGKLQIKRRKRSATQYADVNLGKKSEERCESETKQHKHTAKDGIAVETSKEATPPRCKVSEKGDEVLGDFKLKPKQQSEKKARGRGVNGDRSAKQTISKKLILVPAASDKGISEASGAKKKNSKAAMKPEETPKKEVKRKHSTEKDMKKTTSKAAVELSNRDGDSSDETPKTKVKRKKTAEKGVASKRPEVDEQLVGSRIKVWWPMDKKFYEGVVDSYNKVNMKHKIAYADGDVETLNLKKQRWELIGPAEEEQETDTLKPDASSDTSQKEKENTKSEPAKGTKRKSSSRRKSSSIRSKSKARKPGGAKRSKPDISDGFEKFTGDMPKEEDEDSSEDYMDVETQKSESDSQQTAKETHTKVGSESTGDESGGGGMVNRGEMSKEAKKEGCSNEVGTD